MVSVPTSVAEPSALLRSMFPFVVSAVMFDAARFTAVVLPIPVTAFRSTVFAVTSPAPLIAVPAVIVTVCVPPAVVTSVSVMPPVVVNLILPLAVVTPVTSGRQAPAVTVPTVKPPRSLNSMLPSVVEIAANVPVIWLFTLSRSMLFLALTPKLPAVIVPLAL